MGLAHPAIFNSKIFMVNVKKCELILDGHCTCTRGLLSYQLFTGVFLQCQSKELYLTVYLGLPITKVIVSSNIIINNIHDNNNNIDDDNELFEDELVEEVEAYTQQDDVEDDDSSGCTSSTRLDSPSDIALSIQDNPVQPHNHQFPSTYFGNKYRSFNPEWFHKNVWLEYSISKDAVFCYACRFFSLGSANDVFVKTGYRDWKHCTGKAGRIAKHSNSVKHK